MPVYIPNTPNQKELAFDVSIHATTIYWILARIFGLNMPSAIRRYLLTSGKQIVQIVYTGDEIQKRDSVLCGYWCLYYLLERQKGRSILETMSIRSPHFDFSDQSVNYRFINNISKVS